MSLTYLPFLEVLRDVSGGTKKVKKQDYQPKGLIPVIDQGKSLIGGYTDNIEDQFKKTKLPVIIFGDHTKNIKFIDQPFAMGADGIKILKPTSDKYYEKYIYHYLCQLRLTNGGYDRHYKYLKRISIPIPSLREQKRIAAILDQADALRNKRRKSITKLDELLQSVFLDMFGDPVTNPKGWDKHSLNGLLNRVESGWSPNCENKPARNDEWGVLKLGSVTWGKYNALENKAFPVSKEPRPELEVKKGDLLFTRKNTYDLVAATAYVWDTQPKLMIPDLIFRLAIKDKTIINPIFLWQQLANTHMRKSIQNLAGGAAGSMPNISKAKLNCVEVVVPPVDLQKKYASLLMTHRKQFEIYMHSKRSIDLIFASLQQRAFRGDL